MSGFIFILFFGGFFILIVRVSRRNPYDSLTLSSHTKLTGYRLFRPAKLQKNDEHILLKNLPFYNALSAQQRLKFQGRLMRFICLKNFETRGGLRLNNEMVILISSAAVQLTFGLNDYRFLHFTTIIIYPDQFFSKRNQQYHLGETNSKGSIAFSWKHLQTGYANAYDNINLGIHEFSHALFLNHVAGKKDDFYFEEEFENWKQAGSRSFFKLKREGSDYLRPYAQANFMEFFAVTVECFFETPDELLLHHPTIYQSLQQLLRLDTKKLYQKSAIPKAA